MVLAEGIREVLSTRGISSRELVQRIPKGGGRWAAYSVLSGRSADPRLSTFLILCAALDVSPTELLQLAGLWQRSDRGDTAGDVRLRGVFRAVQDLGAESRELATYLLDASIQALQTRENGTASPAH